MIVKITTDEGLIGYGEAKAPVAPQITKQIIDKRMLSGELDDSGLTLSDLARIREAFIPLLTGIHHARIVYPGQKAHDSERIPERRGERKAGT